MPDNHERIAAALADRYRIIRLLGQGGMASVFLADDLKHDRKVAIKVLKPELAAVLGAERFVVEIKTTAALSHPHILPLFDSGTADGFLYYVMPYIEGETIRDRLNRETQLSVDESLRITREIADALDYAHRHGVIHRDIKPENILLHDGRAMVMDFGIALAVSAAAGGRMTETGLSLGTPHYMSPEQATADKAITGRSDVYSLASVCYEMLAGEPPHTGSSAQQIIMKIVTDSSRPVSELRKSVPQNVVAALSKALEKLPADRFESAKAFGDALVNQHFATAATPAAAGGSSRRTTGLVAGLVLGLAAGVGAMFLLRPSASATSEASRSQLTFNGLATRPAISPDGQRIAYVVSACTAADTDCRVSLEVLEVGGTKAQVLIPAARVLAYPRWSHDGETVVIGGLLDQGRPGIFAIARRNATPRLIYDGIGMYDTHPTADSAVVITLAADTMMIVDLADATVRDRVPVSLSSVASIAWAPSGKRLAIHDVTGLHVLGRDGKEQGSLPESGGRPTIRWSVSGDALLYFTSGRAREDELVRRSVSADGVISEGFDVVMPRTPTLYSGAFDLARGTGVIVFMTGEARTDLWSFDLSTGPVRGKQETRGTTWYGSPVISPDNRTLYYYRGDALGDNVYRLDRATQVEEALTAEASPGRNEMMLSPDGSRLGFGRLREKKLLMQELDVPSRRVRSAMVSGPGIFVPVATRGFLGLSEQAALVFYDSLGATPRTVVTSDSLTVVTFAATPDGGTAVFVALERTAAVDNVSAVLAAVPIKGGPIKPLARWVEVPGFQAGGPPAVSVSLDGSIFVGRWPRGDERPSLWRGDLRGATLTKLVTIPERCDQSTLVVGWSGRTATCVVSDFRADMWLVDLGQAAR